MIWEEYFFILLTVTRICVIINVTGNGTGPLSGTIGDNRVNINNPTLIITVLFLRGR